MIRTRVDGTKFQEEVKRGLDKLLVPNFQVRLHTNWVRSIADFILFSKTVSILEVKETSAKSYSTKTMQQKEAAESFQEFYKVATQKLGKLPYRLYIMIHFIAEGSYVVYDLTEELIIIHAKNPEGQAFTNLKDALGYILGRSEW